MERPNIGEGDQWAPVVDALDKFDSHMVESGKESIDSFLTFVSDIESTLPRTFVHMTL